MDVLLLAIVFLAIIIVLFIFKKPLFMALIVSIILAILLYQLSFADASKTILSSLSSYTTISVLLIFYLITFIQRMMEHEKALSKSQSSIAKLVNNRRIDAALSPSFMGLLPSASAVYLAGSMVNASCQDDLSNEDKTFVTSYFRHAAESFLPTYPSIIIAVSLTGMNMNHFIIAMLPMVLTYVLLGYFFFLRKIPLDKRKEQVNYKVELMSLLKLLFPIVLVLVLILVFKIEAQYSALVVAIIYILYQRYTPKQIIGFAKSAFEAKVLVTTALIFIFKDLITYTNVIEQLPPLFEQLPIPLFIIYGLIFFVGSLVLGNSGAAVIILPLAFAIVPDANLAFLVYLNSLGFIAMQIAPTHICLHLACEYFKTNFSDLIKRTAPILIIFVIIANLYYLLLNAF